MYCIKSMSGGSDNMIILCRAYPLLVTGLLEYNLNYHPVTLCIYSNLIFLVKKHTREKFSVDVSFSKFLESNKLTAVTTLWTIVVGLSIPTNRIMGVVLYFFPNDDINMITSCQIVDDESILVSKHRPITCSLTVPTVPTQVMEPLYYIMSPGLKCLLISNHYIHIVYRTT